MKSEKLSEMSSGPAPSEWRNIKEIADAKPKAVNVEKSLQKLDGLDVCFWMTGWGGVWKPANELFHVKTKKV